MVVPLVELFLGKNLSAKLVVASLLSFFGVGVLELGPEATLTPPVIFVHRGFLVVNLTAPIGLQ